MTLIDTTNYNCYYVEICRYAEDADVPSEDIQVVKRMGPMPEWRANRVDDGVNINLNHEEYFTRIVTDETGSLEEIN